MPSHLPDPSRNQKLSAAVGQGLKKGPQINSTNDLREGIQTVESACTQRKPHDLTKRATGLERARPDWKSRCA